MTFQLLVPVVPVLSGNEHEIKTGANLFQLGPVDGKKRETVANLNCS